MKVEIQKVNQRGRAIPAKERKGMEVYRGILKINETRSHMLGRIAPHARLVSEKGTEELEVLPTLIDAIVLYVKGNQMRIRGFELVEGIQFGQTWDVEVKSC